MEKTDIGIPLTEEIIARPLIQEEQGMYEDYVRSQNYNKRALRTLDVPLNESSLFKVILLNQMGIRTATLDDLEILVHSIPNLLRDRTESIPSIILRSTQDFYRPNDVIFKSLTRMVERKSRSPPIVFSGLRIVGNDSDEDYGLGFEKGTNFEAVETPEFKNENHKRTFSRIENGVPLLDQNIYDIILYSKGPRIFYSRPNGVSPISLSGKGISGLALATPIFASWHFDLHTCHKDLDYTDVGPVIVVQEDPSSLTKWRH